MTDSLTFQPSRPRGPRVLSLRTPALWWQRVSAYGKGVWQSRFQLLYRDKKRDRHGRKLPRDDRFFYISTLPTKTTACFVIANSHIMTTTSLSIQKGGMVILLLSLGLNEKERSPRCARDDRFFYISTLPTKRTACFVIATPRGLTTTSFSIRKGGVAISLYYLGLNEKERSPRFARDDRLPSQNATICQW